MKKLIPFVLMMSLALILVLSACQSVQTTSFDNSKDSLSMAFYNVENLFDLEDDPSTFDEEFTPTGKKAWTKDRYETKLLNLGRVVSSMDESMPDIIGLCEIENRKVIEDLNNSPYFKGVKYEIIHQDSPDGRGIDVGLMYNASKIKLELAGVIESTLPAGDRPKTRLILHAKGTLQGQDLHIFVNHWPSRSGGQAETEPNRLTVAFNLRNYIDKVLAENPEAMIVLMGDFNDHPNNKSINDILKAGKGDDYSFENLMWEMHKNGQGSYNFRGEWGALDQFMVSRNLVDGEGIDVDRETVKAHREDWMMYVNDKGEASPSRTYGGPNYYGGYSDHLPIFMELRLGN